MLGKTLEEFLRRDGRKKSELAATCGLLPSAITKVIQGDSYSPDMAGRIIRGFDSKSRRAALLSAYLEEIIGQTKLEGGLVKVQPAGECSFHFPVPPHLREVFAVLGRECTQDPGLEQTLNYMASRFEDYKSGQALLAENDDKQNGL